MADQEEEEDLTNKILSPLQTAQRAERLIGEAEDVLAHLVSMLREEEPGNGE